MFLGKLPEAEKQAFLCLANKVMKADGIIEEREMEVINTLRGEMNAPNLVSNLTEEESYKVFSVSKTPVKKAVYLELLGIAIADGGIVTKENEVLAEFASRLRLSDKFTGNALKWIDHYFSVLQKGISLVSGKPKNK